MEMKETSVIAVHGMWEGPWIYEPFIQNTKHDFIVTTVELPGHGSGNRHLLKDAGLPDYIAATYRQVSYRLQEGYKTVILAGHSLGGLLACHAAVEFQGRIDGLVLVNSAPLYRARISREVGKRIWRYVPDILLGRPFLPSFEDMYALELSKCRNPEDVYGLMGPESGIVARQLALSAPILGRYLPNIREVRCPVRLLAGMHDKITPLAIQQRNAALFGKTTVDRVTGGDHIKDLWERPNIIRAMVNSIITRT